MSTPRDDVATTVHKHLFLSTVYACSCGWSPTRGDSSHDHHVADEIEKILGLEDEWGVEYEATDTEVIYVTAVDEQEAREMVADSPTDTGLRVRLVTKWAEPR